MKNAVVALQNRLRGERNPEGRRVTAEAIAEECRGGDSDDGDRLVLQMYGSPEQVRISAVVGLPCLIADHGDGCGRCLVISLGEHAAGKWPNAKD